MMGRAGDGAHKFVLTDEDMLDFVLLGSQIRIIVLQILLML